MKHMVAFGVMSVNSLYSRRWSCRSKQTVRKPEGGTSVETSWEQSCKVGAHWGAESSAWCAGLKFFLHRDFGIIVRKLRYEPCQEGRELAPDDVPYRWCYCPITWGWWQDLWEVVKWGRKDLFVVEIFKSLQSAINASTLVGGREAIVKNKPRNSPLNRWGSLSSSDILSLTQWQRREISSMHRANVLLGAWKRRESCAWASCLHQSSFPTTFLNSVLKTSHDVSSYSRLLNQCSEASWKNTTLANLIVSSHRLWLLTQS